MNREITTILRWRRVVISVGVLSLALSLAGTPVEAGGLALVPVSATGGYTVDGQTIYVAGGGHRVFLEVRLAGWNPALNGDPKLRTYQYQLDSAGFTSGTTGSLTLPFIEIPCATQADCPGYNSGCNAGVCDDNGAFFLDENRSDYVFFGIDTIYAANLINPNPILGVTLPNALDAVADDGTSKYGGTVVLDVSEGASGTFTVGFATDQSFTFWVSGNNEVIPLDILTPAVIEVGAPCTGNDPGLPDCNGNGQIDVCDIWSGTSTDCSGNGIPDECEPDCNGNGHADDCDITGGTSQDCNGNGIPDECDLGSGYSADCNGNGIPDSCDIAGGTSSDCNGNHTPDSCDVASGSSDDCNGNGTPDECDGLDCNANGQLDACDLASGISVDTNGNGIPDECDDVEGFALVPIRSTGGVYSVTGRTIAVEPGAQRITFEIRVGGWDPDLNGVPLLAGYQVTIDSATLTSGTAGSLSYGFSSQPCVTNNDCHGMHNVCVSGVCSGEALWVDESHPNYIFLGLGTLSATSFAQPNPAIGTVLYPSYNNAVADTGGARYVGTLTLDLSADAEGTFTVNFVDDFQKTFYFDENSYSWPPAMLQPATVEVVQPCTRDLAGTPDCNHNGVRDFCDLLLGTSSDCNGNDLPDDCEADCNGNGLLASGTSVDLNNTGVPDECESYYGNGVALVPVSATGAYTIDGQTIHLDTPGQQVTLEVWISGWDVDRNGSPRLQTYQVQLGAAGFTSGYAGSLALGAIDIPCVTNDDCPGYAGTCDLGVCNGNGAFFVDESHPGYVFSGLQTVSGANTVDPNPFFGATLWNTSDCVAETVEGRYAGTIVLDVSEDAAGAFTVGFLDHGSFYDSCDGIDIPIPALLPATIDVNLDCNGNGVLDPLDVLNGTSPDDDGNGVPDECDIMPIVNAEGARYLEVTIPAEVTQASRIVVRCEGGLERYVDYPIGDADNTAMLLDDEAAAPYLTPQEWMTPIYVTGMPIGAEQTYSVCLDLADGRRSASAGVTTGMWGDVSGPGAGATPDGTVDFRDIYAMVERFIASPTAPPAVRCDLQPDLPDGVIDMRDIAKAVSAFLDSVYPYDRSPDCTAP